MPAGLQENQRLEAAIWTPSTKAEAGEHDENISQAKAAEIVGIDVAKKVEKASLEIYELVSPLFQIWPTCDPAPQSNWTCRNRLEIMLKSEA